MFDKIQSIVKQNRSKLARLAIISGGVAAGVLIAGAFNTEVETEETVELLVTDEPKEEGVE